MNWTRLHIIGIICLGIVTLSLLTGSTAHAQNTGLIIINSVNPEDQSTNVPVDQLSKGITFTYQYHGVINHQSCKPLQNTITNYATDKPEPTVDLIGPNQQHIPLYTVSHTSKPVNPSDSNTHQFSLKYAESHYELQPDQWYELRLRGGANGLAFSCSNSTQPYLLQSQGYTFRFQTGKDNIAPSLSNIKTEQSFDHATISWQTSDKQATSTVHYGLNGDYTHQAKVFEDPNLYYQPYATAPNLQSGKKYNYKISSSDKSGNTTTKTGTFTTLALTNQPKIDQITGSSARISWKTNAQVASAIHYGPTPETKLGSQSTKPSTIHDFRLVHLQPNQKYFIKIQIKSGLYTATTATHTFTTGPDPNAGIAMQEPLSPQFTTQFDFSSFNLKDFPPDQLSATNSAQASQGAVLASTNEPLSSIAGNFSKFKHHNPWIVWLWIPIILLLSLITAVWLLWRHEQKVNTINTNNRLQK